ncbi:MAG: energy-coupling factor transporter transmembrane protein EcfT [Clostridia bacterium]|nr:energy-coupling factor transporter transmembrane protein EcfT [Clostridia bacterium]
MRPPSLYVPGSTPVHRADPVTKGVWAASLTLAGFLVPDWRGLALLFLLNAAVLARAGVLRRVAGLVLASALLVVTFFVAQGLTHAGSGEVAFRAAGLPFYREGLVFALTLAFRLWNTILAMGVLVLTTRPQDLVAALLMRGFPPRAGYAVASVVQLLPTVWAAVAAVLDAQRSRGVETDGGLGRRLRALLPMLGPLVMASLTAAQERAVALEVRGFSRKGPRTVFRPVADMPGALAVRSLGLALFAASAAWRAVL